MLDTAIGADFGLRELGFLEYFHQGRWGWQEQEQGEAWAEVLLLLAG